MLAFGLKKAEHLEAFKGSNMTDDWHKEIERNPEYKVPTSESK